MTSKLLFIYGMYKEMEYYSAKRKKPLKHAITSMNLSEKHTPKLTYHIILLIRSLRKVKQM